MGRWESLSRRSVWEFHLLPKIAGSLKSKERPQCLLAQFQDAVKDPSFDLVSRTTLVSRVTHEAEELVG